MCVFVAGSNASFAQQALNLDFEEKSMEGISRPWGWSIDSFSNTIVEMDSAVTRKGKFSLRMEYLEASKTSSEMMLGYGIEPYELKNNTIRIQGWIKTKDLKGKALISLGYTLSSDDVKIEGEQKSEQIAGSTNWTPVSVEIKVPEEARMVYLSLQYLGNGQAWFDDLSLSIGAKVFSSVEVDESFTETQIEWLNENSYSIEKVDASDVSRGEQPYFKDLRPFGEMAKDARIIALGEATHGTSEFFRLKHRVFEYAVHKLGVRVFALEDNQLIVERANRYVHGGKGTARQSMNGLFSVWQNREVHDLISWVRYWNDQNPDDKASFVGFDIQSPFLPIDSLYAFVYRQSEELGLQVSSRLDSLKVNLRNTFTASDGQKKEWYTNSAEVLDMVKKESDTWFRLAGSSEDSMKIHWGIQYANLVKQYAENLFKGHISLYRDVAMAENVSWIMNVYKPGSKIFVWAHDYHVSLGEHADVEKNIYDGISMGAHLRKKYGENYQAFGISTYDGTYWAQLGYTNFTQMSCPLYPAPRGTLDEALHKVILKRSTPALLLDLRSAREERWLTKLIPTRFANHVNIEYGYWTRYSVPYQFDGIFFIDQTSAADSY